MTERPFGVLSLHPTNQRGTMNVISWIDCRRLCLASVKGKATAVAGYLDTISLIHQKGHGFGS